MKLVLFSLTLALLVVSCSNEPAADVKKTSTTQNQDTVVTKAINPMEPLLAPKELITNKDRAIAILEGIESADGSVFRLNINKEKHIQHIHNLENGSFGYKTSMKENKGKGYTIDVIRAGLQGNYAFTHSIYNLDTPYVAIDLMRFEKGKLTEHWRAKEIMSDVNESGHSQIDGSRTMDDGKKTRMYLKHVSKYVNHVLIEGNYNNVNDFVSEENYTEHAKYGQDGISSIPEAYNKRKSKGYELIYDNLERTHGEGNFALSVCSGTLNGSEAAIYDIFRLDENEIVEHWQVVSEIPPSSSWKNDNGPF